MWHWTVPSRTSRGEWFESFLMSENENGDINWVEVESIELVISLKKVNWLWWKDHEYHIYKRSYIK